MMNARQTHMKQIFVAIGVACALGLCAFFVARIFQSDRTVGMPGKAYFYDLKDGTVFVAPASSIPPIEAPSGNGPDGKPTGVRAYIYSCDEDYTDFRGMTTEQVQGSGAYIGYLEKRTDTFKEFIAKTEGSSAPQDSALVARMVKQPNLIRQLGDQRWVPDISPRGQKVQQEARQRCPNATAFLCNPQ